MDQHPRAPRRRGFPWGLLLVAFLVIPLVEIYVIVKVGAVIGAWWTILLLVADSVFGAWLVKHEGSRSWRALRVALAEHRMPARELADGMLVLIGGVLMLTPGFVTDLAGVLCMLPMTRPVGRRVLGGLISRSLVSVSFPGDFGTPQRPGPTNPGSRPGNGPEDGVIQGEVVQEWPEDGSTRPR